MPYALRVTRPFDGYDVGRLIEDQTEIDRVLKPGHSHNVVRVWQDEPDEVAKNDGEAGSVVEVNDGPADAKVDAKAEATPSKRSASSKTDDKA